MAADKEGLADLKLTGAERRPYAHGPAESQMEYSYGLCVRLENAELEKLGVKRLPEVDDEYTIIAVAKVKSVHEERVQPGKENRAVNLQITHMKLK